MALPLHKPLAAVPTIEEIGMDPSRASGLSREVIAALQARCAVVQSALATAQLNLAAEVDSTSAGSGDRLLAIEEAAAKLGCTEDWLYRRASSLPFAVRLGPGQLRFSLLGMEKFIRAKTIKGGV